MIRVKSFSYRDGQVPHTMYVVDCRSMRNPYSDPELRSKTGLDPYVQLFVKKTPGFDQIIATAVAHVEDGETLAFGCLGGKHRSVTCAEIAAESLRAKGYEVEVEHTALVAA